MSFVYRIHFEFLELMQTAYKNEIPLATYWLIDYHVKHNVKDLTIKCIKRLEKQAASNDLHGLIAKLSLAECYSLSISNPYFARIRGWMNTNVEEMRKKALELVRFVSNQGCANGHMHLLYKLEPSVFYEFR